jgi:hypothetical protein
MHGRSERSEITLRCADLTFLRSIVDTIADKKFEDSIQSINIVEQSIGESNNSNNCRKTEEETEETEKAKEMKESNKSNQWSDNSDSDQMSLNSSEVSERYIFKK